MREDSSCGHNRSLMGEAECHRSSVGSHDTRSIAERSEDGRTVSVVSSVSSCSSLEGNITPSAFAGDINLELIPPKAPTDPPEPDWTVSEPVITSSERRKDPPSPIASVAMAPNPHLTYVDRVVMEIIETERTYVRDLRSIVEDYLVHIIDSRDLPIKPEQVCSLFGNIEQIYEFNSELFHTLDACACDPVAIARCFVDKSEYFEIYTQYCTNYPNSVAVLTECLRNKSLAKFLRDRQASLRHSLPLGSYLLKPVQRILKYHLLLQEIAKHFDSEEDGYDVVIDAIDTMTGVAWYINDMKRKHEHAVRLQEIQSLLINWKGLDLTSYGELVLDGTFHVHRAKNERTLFLFHKMLLITKKRGEHYVYKTHISCSTLMLIESAKDLLCFSVTHYKHPKQPHTVQARTVEEKKLWAHHIKRLILENHHVVIPQKAKDALLDMDSSCLVKHRYSPDRMKKATSCRVDDFSACALKERRRSEPGKQITRSSRGSLKHADSEGALLVVKQRRSLPPAADVSALSAEIRQNHQDLESSTGSLYHPDESRPHGEQEDEQKSADDRGEDEQVADFTTSVLAALSCLQYRARALLSHPITTDTDGCCITAENWSMSKSRPASHEQKCQQMSDGLTFVEQSSSELHGSQKISCPLGDAVEDVMSPSHSYTQTGGTVVHRYNTDPAIRDLCNGGGAEEEDLEDSVCFSSPEVQDKKEISQLMGNMDDMEIDEEVAAHGGLLPSSVLDKASDFSELFPGSPSRGISLGADGSCDMGCPSSRSESRRSSLLSCSTEIREKEFRRSTPEPVHQTAADRSFRPDQRPQKKNDTLSNNDRMLIHKIRRYYEHAEDQDASFAIKRRESLSYIPAGLVRNLSRQLNDHMSDEDMALHKRASSIMRPTSWAVFNLPALESESRYKECIYDSKTSDGDEMCSKDEEFRPASDMVKVWQEMEVKRSSEEPPDSLEITESSCTTTPDQEKRAEISKISSDSGLGEPLLILEESDEGSTPSRVNTRLEKDENHEFQSYPNQEHKVQERHEVNHSPLPKIISLKSANEEDLILQDMEKMKNKVFQLARQYSQRIKNSRPVVRQRHKVTESHLMANSLSSVIEEKPLAQEKGLPDRTLSLDLNEQDLVQDSENTSPSSSICSPGSPQFPYFCRLNIQRPQSPVQVESFHWPDVKELCSKYSNQGQKSISHRYPMGRGVSFPERMLDHEREVSCSSLCNFTTQRATNTDLEAVPSLCRVNSLDHDLETQHTRQQPDNCCVTGHRTLSSEIMVENVCRVKQSLETEDRSEGRGRWDAVAQSELALIECTEQDVRFGVWVRGGQQPCLTEETQNSQHNLVKNLREKFQNQSSYT
ncbi:pleckstrin homology domain-containing family G member 3 isoform X2 [Triplophysa dalaica]|uniref:pleckstrin homology domain-containing family G member 3 isoform X2 n=1 Tax=Triplophysa dalaica TaxID=1582913 RepID=UPI0024DFEF83|nr:pleckstrin homology domain-containing family G member 3 isoform X2 [Triplophysa dalaica]